MSLFPRNPSAIMIGALTSAIGVMLTLFTFYYFFISFKNINKKKTKFTLHTGFLASISLGINYIGFFLMVFYADVKENGWVYYVKFEYGFLYQSIAIILLILLYIFQYKNDSPRLITVPARIKLYRGIVTILGKYSPLVEPVSIDEAYINLKAGKK